MNQQSNDILFNLIKQKLGAQVLFCKLDLGDVVVGVKSENLYDILKLLKIDSELKFDMLLSVTAVDWMDQQEQRFELVYHLLSLSNLYRIRIKSFLEGESPEVPSVCDLWSGANFMEREVWDMYGVSFKGHPDLRRILMYDEFVGHPLRKDYPLQAKQPRIPLRSPEVHNTARDMIRPALVKIGENKKASGM